MISYIKLKNFKCFVDEPFDMAQLTLFTGINGMGKSSVIQSLLLLKQSYDVKYLQTSNKVILGIRDRTLTNLESASAFCNLTAFPKEVEIEIESETNLTHKWKIDASSASDNELPVTYSGPGNYQNEALFNERFIYLTAERWGPRLTYERKPGTKDYNTKLGVQGELTPAYILDAIKRNEEIGIAKLKHPSARTNELYENLNLWLSDILSRGLSAKVNEVNENTVKLSFNIKGTEGGDISSLQVGFGFSFSLPVILAPLIAKPGDLIIIENPEAHLHPSAQSKIGKLLAHAAQNGVQVIIETHSDHVLNGIRVATKEGKIDTSKTLIHFFNSVRDDVSNNQTKITFAIENDGGVERWPNGFFDEWDKMMDELTDDKI